ncbi:MAG TPA: hypothetical protein VF267_01710 [Gammaproteobacteria bacterium]
MTASDPRADLAYIRHLMEDTRRAACVSGGYFIVWGVVIGLGLIATWARIAGYWTVPPFAAWVVCLALGGIGTFFLVRRELREPVEGPAGRLIGMVWMSMGITMMIIFFIGVGSGSLGAEHMSALSSALVGGAVFLTGALSGLAWLRNLSFAWWAGAAVMFAWPGVHVLLLMGVMLLALYVVPGLLLIRMNRGARIAARESDRG